MMTQNFVYSLIQAWSPLRTRTYPKERVALLYGDDSGAQMGKGGKCFVTVNKKTRLGDN